MSDNRKLASDIRELDKGISDCENFLAKVLNRKIDCSRQVPAAKKKNASVKSTSRPESRGRSQTRQRAPSAGVSNVKDSTRSFHPVRKPPSTVGSTKRISPEPNVKPKTNDGQRKRSISVSRITPQSCKCEPPKQANPTKLSHHIHMPSAACIKPPPTKNELAIQVMRSRSPESRNKHLSWGEILRENHQSGCKPNKGQWDIGRLPYSTQVNSVQYPSYNTKLPHECEPIKESNSRSNEFTCPVPGNLFFKAPASRHHPTEESFSSEGTSGFSSNNDLPSNLTNKSIQCGSPIPKSRPKSGPPDHYVSRRLSSSSSGASSQKVEEKDAKIAGILGSDVFTMFNPVRTLNFLIKELQGMLNKNPKEDASICRIIADMEKVLHRLPEGGERTETSSGYTTRSKHHDSHSVTSASTQSYDVAEKPVNPESDKIAILQALEAVPALARRIDERTESMRKKILEARSHVPIPTLATIPSESNINNVDSILKVQRHLEVSGGQLEIMCRAMEQTCEALKNERDVLKVEVEARDKEIRVVKSQEQDFVTTVNTLRTNLEGTTRRATQLSVENKLLKEQVKLIPSLQESDAKVKELTAEVLLLREETKDLPALRASQIELKVLAMKCTKLEEENKEIPTLRIIEEKYKQMISENTKLKDENKAIPSLKEKEEKVVYLTSVLEKVQEGKKKLEEKVSELNLEIQSLKGEVQNQLGVAEATKRLTSRLQEMMKERDEAQHELHILHIEREKLLILSRNKDEQLAHFVQDILNIKEMVTSQLNNLKISMPRISSPLSPISSSSSDSEDITTTVTSQCQPVCSSPTSTISGVPPVGEDWQAMSTILPEHTRSSPEILISTQPKKSEDTISPPNFKSLDKDSWQSLVPDTRPPTDHIDVAAVGDNQWVGAAAVTQELQQNVKELFRLINSNAVQEGSSSSPVTSSVNTARTMSSQPCATVTSAASASVGVSAGTGVRSHSMPASQTTCRSSRNFHYKMPVLPDPPKFLDTPEFSDFSSYHGSLVESSSVESIDSVLKELQRNDHKRK